MFGGAKPTFGTGTPGTGFGGFNAAANASPFGQSAFGKPATTAFGAGPTFGTQQTAPSLFGAASGQQQTTGLFGGASTSSAFGTTTTAQPAFGSFSQQQQNTSIFGAAQPANNTSLFGQTATSAFGSAVKPAGLGGFGQASSQPTTLFGQQPTQTSSSGFGAFGQAAPTTTNVFGSSAGSAFGQTAGTVATGTNAGTSIAKYQPIMGTDTLMKGGQPNNVNTKQHCITAMKEYESKSLEELRMEDYLSNRKGPQAGSSTTGGFFGATSQPAANTVLFGQNTQQTTGIFGQQGAATTENKGLFGASAFGQNQQTGFGSTTQQNSFGMKPFGATGTTGFGGTANDGSANPFGSKPAFGTTAAPSLFGQTPATSNAPNFGQTTSGFGGFGTTAGNTQQPSLFGGTAQDPNKPTFGLGTTSTANTGFGGFGTTATSTANTGLFGAKPTTGFGQNPGFGQTSQPNTGFSNFSLNNNATGTGLFNSSMNKPPTSSFGSFGAQTSSAPLNFNAGNTGGTLFGNTAAKPGGLFGGNYSAAPNNAGNTGLFGNSNNTTNAWGGGGGAFGNTLMGGNVTQNTLGGTPQQQTVPIHQQILSKVTSPYGDNPIFKDLKRSDETDASRATNPEAQKAIIESTNNSFKVSAKSNTSAIKVKPLGTALTKKSLFEGLEESDSTVESFTLKPNAKRLIIKPKSNNSLNSGTGSQMGTPNTSLINTANVENNSGGQQLNSSASRNEMFAAGIPVDSPVTAATSNSNSPVLTAANKENDSSRRESWLHPNNLEKVRQHNLNTGLENNSPLNSTLTELVPRKPLETYRAPTTTARLSVSTVPENPFEGQNSTISRRETVTFAENANDSLFSNRLFGGEDQRSQPEEPIIEYDEHPTGITLTRIGYYTVPNLDELKSYLAEDGSCVVPNFTVGRKGYGNVYFPKEMDVAGLNLDEIVHFRNKEVTIYPDDENKPPIGSELNREAQVTLDNVWPLDKTKHEPIKNPDRLLEMDWEGKLRRVCDKNETRFVEYRPETGSWVFRVKHFSKYGLNDSDEDDTAPVDPKKAKMTEASGKTKQTETSGMINVADKFAALRNAQMKLSESSSLAPVDQKASDVGAYTMDESAEFMLIDKTQYFQNNFHENFMFEQPMLVTSPTAALAKEAGTDSHKLQLMKASFFVDDDSKSVASELEHDQNRNMVAPYFRAHKDDFFWRDDNNMRPTSCLSSVASGQLDTGLNFVVSPQMPSTASLVSVLYGGQTESITPLEHDKTTFLPITKFAPFIIRPKVAMIKPLAAQVPFSKSKGYQLKNTYAADLGLYNIRRFKTSFGPQNTLIVPNTRNNLKEDIINEDLQIAAPKIFRTRADNDYSATIMQHVKIASTQHYVSFNESIVDHLKIQLHNSLLQAVESSECPYITSNAGTDLIVKHLDEAIKQINISELEQYAVSVWSLCLALWGEHEELEGHEASSHFAVMCRRNLLSEWLENTLTDKDLLAKNISKHTYLEHLVDLIMCHKVTEACELAFKYDDANMALLLSQLSSGPVVRQLIEDQLAAWHKNGADKFIQIERLKLFMFVAGVGLMNSEHGPINILEDISWIKVLALHLWYLTSPTSSITDALLAYEKSFEAADFKSLPPRPAYEEMSDEVRSKHTVYDLRYHLLQLFSKRSHPLESLINPATHTTDPMDYRLSWLLLQTLEALGYHHCSELSECQLHVGFAAQLENYGLWEWAIFVLLHIKERNQRELAVQHILYRYVSAAKDISLTDKEKFVIQSLGVPEKWIDYAKAVKAGSLGNTHMQAKYLLKAKQWNLAHEIIYQHIAPDAVINDNLDYLHNLLTQFENSELNTNIKVPNWSNQGQIFLDFIDINEKFKSLKSLQNTADIEARWENLKPQLADLCSRINLLPCPTAKHRLCQSEIAQNLAILVRGVLLVCPDLNPCLIIKIALERLPLPQEFAQQELRALLDTLVNNLSKTRILSASEAMAIN